MILLIDNYDSFTFNLKDYVEQLGHEVTVVRNDDAQLDNGASFIQQFDGMILSPGPGTPAESGKLMDLIGATWSSKPILGICLGHQALGEFFGTPLIRAPYPMHGKISVATHAGHGMFDEIPKSFEVCRYHSLVLDTLKGNELEVTAYADDQTIMAIAHTHLPLWGVQYHPEAILTEYGLRLIDNWLKVVTLQHR